MVADHRRILATAISRLRAKIKYRPVLFELMPPRFTLSELQKTAEALSGIPLHKQNFRRLIAQQGLVEETGEVAMDRSEEHTSELQSLMRTSYAVFRLKKKNDNKR